MTDGSYKLRYAGVTFIVVLLAALAVGVLLDLRHAADTRTLSTLAESAARERVDPELSARARSVADHAAESVAGAVRAQDAGGVQRRLQPFMDDSTVASLTLTARSGEVLYHWHRATAAPANVMSAQASAAVRTLVENIPGAVTPETLATLSVVVEQAASPGESLRGRLEADSAPRTHLNWWLTVALAALGAVLATAIIWRALARDAAPDRLAHPQCRARRPGRLHAPVRGGTAWRAR